MIAVRMVDANDLAVIVEAYPEPRSPQNRHVARFALQQTDDVTCLATWDGDRPIGWIFIRWPGGNGELTEQAVALGCVELGDLFVAEAARGQGAGRALMEAAEALVAGRGYALVGGEVTVANPHTDVARGLYERMGYRDAGLGEFVSGTRTGTRQACPIVTRSSTATSRSGSRNSPASAHRRRLRGLRRRRSVDVRLGAARLDEEVEQVEAAEDRDQRPEEVPA